jgi:NADH oxidase (H2O2-forming)
MAGNEERVLVIGGGIAGRNVCRELIRLGKSAGITLVKKESHGSYSPCGIPYVLGGEVETMEDIIFSNFDRRLINDNVRLITGTEVKKIDLLQKRAETDKGESLPYDRLVIATGRKPHMPMLPGIEKAGVYTLSNYQDGLHIYTAIRKARRVVIIGGGFIGCELAAAFLRRNIETTLIEIKLNLLPQILDESMAQLVRKELTDMGCHIITGMGASRINGADRVESVSVDKSKSTIGADIVLIATGIVPDAALAGTAGIEIGELGGVSTDDRQRPRMDGKLLEDVYALGDCVEVKNKLTGRNTLSPLTETAIVQARIVSLDIMHKKVKLVSEVKKGCVCSALTVVGNLQIGMTGLTTSEAEKAGIQPRVVQVSGWSKEVYFPGKTKKHIKLLLDGDRLIGAQVIGTEGVRGLINEINAFIHASSRVGDIVCRQRGYTPALSSSPDLLMRALEKLST